MNHQIPSCYPLGVPKPLKIPDIWYLRKQCHFLKEKEKTWFLIHLKYSFFATRSSTPGKRKKQSLISKMFWSIFESFIYKITTKFPDNLLSENILITYFFSIHKKWMPFTTKRKLISQSLNHNMSLKSSECLRTKGRSFNILYSWDDDTVYPFTNVLYGGQDWIAWTQEVIEKRDLSNLLFDELLMLYTHL